MTRRHIWALAPLAGLLLSAGALAQTYPGQAYPAQPYRGQPYRGQPDGSYVRGSEQLAIAAHNMSLEAMRLQRVVQGMTGYSHLSDDANRLAQSAEQFHESVEQGTPLPALQRSFARLQREYTHMRGMLFDIHRRFRAPAVTQSWSRVAGSFETLALTAGVSSDQLCALPDEYH